MEKAMGMSGSDFSLGAAIFYMYVFPSYRLGECF